MNLFKSSNKNNNIDNSNFTLELKELFEYIKNTLQYEFPTNIITLEYLIMSILDNRYCHAHLILDSCLMSNNLEELRKIYFDVLEKHIRPQLQNYTTSYSEELIQVIEYAKNESKKLNQENIGSEDILLAILNKDNNLKIAEIFDKFMLNYSTIFEKCNISHVNPIKKVSSSNSSKKQQIKKTENKNEDEIKQLKPSQLTPKIISFNNANYIEQYTTNLNRLVQEGKVDKLIGRTQEINEIIETLSRRKKNNAILVGDNGVGKTAIVYGIAKMIEEGTSPSVLSDIKIIALNSTAIVSGTNYRGMFEERFEGIVKEMKKSGKYILFLDDIHTMLKNSNKEKDGDLSDVIGQVLSDSEIKVIASTSFKGYRNTIEINSAIKRNFQKIVINSPSSEDTLKIISQNKYYYEEYHNVVYSEESIKRAVNLAERYITDRKLPDSAFDIIDVAGAKAFLSQEEPQEIIQDRKRISELKRQKDLAVKNGDFDKANIFNKEKAQIQSAISEYKRKHSQEKYTAYEIDENFITNVVSEITKIPLSKLTVDDKKKLANIDKTLKQSVIGQDEAIETICKVIKRNKVGLGDKTKTIANIFMCGKSGTGKTLVAKKLAEEIFGDPNALIRIDMSEYSEKSSISKLLGSTAGYVGYENGGLLTEAVKNKPYAILLLDEIEKANSEIHNLFLQLFDDGRLTDGSGHIVNFKNVIVLMTSNIGVQKAMERGNGMGFTAKNDCNSKDIIEKELKKKFTPEFLNRIDKIVYFNSLTDDNLKDIVKLELENFNKRLNEIGYGIKYSDDVINYLHEKAIKNKDMGARPILRLIQDEIEDNITDLLLTEEKNTKNGIFTVTFQDSKLFINVI